jgi:hypothetical protein
MGGSLSIVASVGGMSATAVLSEIGTQVAPTITWPTPNAILYGTALSSVQLNASANTVGTFTYTPGAGTNLPAGMQTLSVLFAPTDSVTYSTATATTTIQVNNPTPVITGTSPSFVSAGGGAFTLTINGVGFTPNSTVMWANTALVTTYVNGTQVTAQVSAASISSAGTVAVSMRTPSPGGGTSNLFQFEVDSSGSNAVPSFTSTTAIVSAGSTAHYTITLPSTVTKATVACLNLPTGAVCSYSGSSVDIGTSATSPKGNYQITTVFTETLPGASPAGLAIPFLLLPLTRRGRRQRRVWQMLCVGLLLLVLAGTGGCGSSASSTSNPTHQVTSSGSVSLTIQ